MQVTFLGTSSGVPTRNRNVSAVALRLPQKAEIWLFDCGEGTQHQFIKSELRLSQLRKVFITHMHGDHIFGLPGLLSSIGLSSQSKGIDLYGPIPLKKYLSDVMDSCSSRISFPLTVNNVEESAFKSKVLIDEDDLLVRCTPLIHRIPAFAYRVDQKPKPGRFKVELAKEKGIPPGPIYAALQRGEKVEINGEIFDGKNFCGEERPGSSIVYCTDTVFSEASIQLAKGADLLIHEATYSHLDADLAYERKHSTSTMAAQVASEASVGQLVLTHLSPRYAPKNDVTPKDLLNEARAIFPNTLLAKDFLQIEVKPGCNSS